MFSQHDIQKLGKRLRDGSRSQADIEMLENFRVMHDPLLIEYVSAINAVVARLGSKFLCAGRPKRTKSIIRKLARPQNRGMDLSRIGDLVGLRVIVKDIHAQNACLAAVTEAFDCRKIHDYRVRADGYRALHVILGHGKLLLELQIRTLIQHLWAEESESFGEIVKEGGGPEEVRTYLSWLSKACATYESSGLPGLEDSNNTASIRRPFSMIHPVLNRKFDEIFFDVGGANIVSSIVVFDVKLGELIHNYRFQAGDRSDALKEFQRLSAFLEEDRYDVVILNSFDENFLKITHSRFFAHQ